jgi:phosphoribosylamine---glycine ligase
MRVLGITQTCDLGSLYMRLIEAGHEVRVSVSEPLAGGTMRGLVPRTTDWRGELAWVRAADSQGLILFEAVGFGELQDELRADGFNVIGGSAFGDQLENDRKLALDLLAKQGLRIAPVVQFSTVDEGMADLAARPRRCAFKFSASAGQTFVSAFDDGRDVAAMLNSRRDLAPAPFILMDYVSGVETGVGAYFDGEQFLRPACLDWEHKRFFAGDMGELTGEMGTVATFESSEAIFTATLAPLEPLFRRAKHVGYVNLNTIINDDGIWPLEFTCRFGYPGFAVLEPLQVPGWDELFTAMICGSGGSFEARPGFSACVVLTTPPFPYSRHEVDAQVGYPLMPGDIAREDLHLGEVGFEGAQLVTSGVYGWTAVVTGTGETIDEARAAAYKNAGKVRTPNVRYRLDIGEKLISGDWDTLAKLGWLKSTPPNRMASQMVR